VGRQTGLTWGPWGDTIVVTAPQVGKIEGTYCQYDILQLWCVSVVGTVDVVQDGETPLHKAAWNGHPEVAKLLLAAGAAVDVPNKVRTGFTRVAQWDRRRCYCLLSSSPCELLRSSKGVPQSGRSLISHCLNRFLDARPTVLANTTST
jgi:hypothetical protein